MENYNSTDIAKYIVGYANDNGIPINMTKLQKLLYIAYGTFLVVKEKRLTDEHPQAWPYGPVFPKTRKALLNEDLFNIRLNNIDQSQFDNTDSVPDLIALVFNNFGNWSAYQLTEWSHREGTPWDQTVSHPDFKWGTIIADDKIQNYFRYLIHGKQ